MKTAIGEYHRSVFIGRFRQVKPIFNLFWLRYVKCFYRYDNEFNVRTNNDFVKNTNLKISIDSRKS